MQKRFVFVLIIVLLLLLSVKPSLAQTAAANTNGPKTAVDEYHNIQVLKDIPADELIPAMQFITYSLGVECSYCHVEGAPEKDDKKTKLTARKMMRMMFEINKDNFDSKQMVTCNSCHRGTPRPVSIPAIIDSAAKAVFDRTTESETAVVNVPSPDQTIKKYVNAIGGATTLAKMRTRAEKGTITIGGRSLPIEILNSAGGKQLTLIHLPNGDSITAYDGSSGWTSSPNHPAHPIPSVEVASARSETDLQLPLHMKQLFAQLKNLPPENVGEHEAYIVAGMDGYEAAAKFYFDKDSGYLLRMVRYTKTPLGENPTQIDYEDYREQDGIKVPLRLTISRPNSRLRIQIEDVKFNVPIDDARFAQPAASQPSP